jgi:Ca2+-binding EF-hand superfamily protein
MSLSLRSFIPVFLTSATIFATPVAVGGGVRESVVRAEFALMDSDRSGGVRVMELARFRKDKGAISWLLTTSTWLDFSRADANGDESIVLEEWRSHRMNREANLLGDQVQRFRSEDRSGDGKLNIREIRTVFSPRLTPQQAKDTLAWLDSDSDGLLTMGEFFRYVELGPDALRGMRRRDAEDLLLAIGGTYSYTMYNGALVCWLDPVHTLYWLRSDADVITDCGYGINLDFLIGRPVAEAVSQAELAGLLPASPMPPGILPVEEDRTRPENSKRPIYIGNLVWGGVGVDSSQAGLTVAVMPPALAIEGSPNPYNFGNLLPLHPYLVIDSKNGIVTQLLITMGSPPRP